MKHKSIKKPRSKKSRKPRSKKSRKPRSKKSRKPRSKKSRKLKYNDYSILTKIQNIYESIKNYPLNEKLKKLKESIIDNIPIYIREDYKNLKDNMSNFPENIKEQIRSLGPEIKRKLSSIGEGIKKTPEYVEYVKSGFSSIGKGIKKTPEYVKSGFSSIGEGIKKTPEYVKSGFNSIGKGIKKTPEYVEYVKSGFSSIGEGIKKTPEYVKSGFSSIKEFFSIFYEFSGGLLNGIKNDPKLNKIYEYYKKEITNELKKYKNMYSKINYKNIKNYFKNKSLTDIMMDFFSIFKYFNPIFTNEQFENLLMTLDNPYISPRVLAYFLLLNKILQFLKIQITNPVVDKLFLSILFVTQILIGINTTKFLKKQFIYIYENFDNVMKDYNVTTDKCDECYNYLKEAFNPLLNGRNFDELSINEFDKLYRKTSLKKHPDKGGTKEEFQKYKDCKTLVLDENCKGLFLV
jgi:hypothetical protein